MPEYISFNRTNNTDLNMYQCGHEECKPEHAYGPAIRDHYLIHYIIKGRGFFRSDGQIHNLRAGQGFLICPDLVTYYEADFKEPWEYVWVGFHGIKAKNYLQKASLTETNPIFTYETDDYLKKCIQKMIATKNLKEERELRLLGHLYLFLSKLIEINSHNNYFKNNLDKKNIYIQKSIEYISMNYSRKISINKIASYIGIGRSYLYSIFMENLGMSPQEFLIKFRLDKACELMENKKLSIGNIARSVGYEDPLSFSKIFKKKRGISPSKYQEEL